MDRSSMDTASLYDALDTTKRDLVVLKEKYEALIQENHVLTKKNELLKKLQCDFETEISSLIAEKTSEKTKKQKFEFELDIATKKIKQLEEQLEEERQNVEFYKNRKENENTKQEVLSLVVADEELYNIQTLKLELEASEDKLKSILEEQVNVTHENCNLKCKIQFLEDDLKYKEQLCEEKLQDIQNLNNILESVQEEMAMATSELNLLKSSESHAARGNSLFAEVEENRQKILNQRNIIKNKYLKLKNLLSSQTAENNKLKVELNKLKRNDKIDEDEIHRDYANLLQVYKTRISELEEKVKTIQEEFPERPPIQDSDGASRHYLWVNTVVEEARKKTRDLHKVLDSRASNYVEQGHELMNSQRENRKLKKIIIKMQCDIDEFQLKLDSGKSAGEETDGTHLLCLEETSKEKKVKGVTFKKTEES